MPLVTAQTWVKQLLDGLIVPGPANIGAVEAFIAPPDPHDNAQPGVYIWATAGKENRQSMPRNLGPGTSGSGWKQVRHDLDIYLIWFDSDEDAYADSAFPSVLDAVMSALRTSPDPAVVTDPYSGIVCQLLGLGEDLEWQSLSVTSTADQRWQRLDALLVAPFVELIQA